MDRAITQHRERCIFGGLTAASSVLALTSYALLLRRFAGSWPESFCMSEVAAQLQAQILSQFAIGLAGVAVANLVARPRAIGLPLSVLALTAAMLQSWNNYRMSRWQWDVGCGVGYDWSPHRAILQLFMTRYLGLLTVILFASVLAVMIIRNLRAAA